MKLETAFWFVCGLGLAPCRASGMEWEMSPSEEFFSAIREGDVVRVEALLEETPSLAATRNDQGVSAPLLALYHQRKELAERLIVRKARLDPLDLFESAAFGRKDRLNEILGERPDLVDGYASDGFFPLGLACFFGHEDAARLLLEKGANPDLVARNAFRVRAIHAAAASGKLPIVKAVIDAGADLNAAQQGGFTALHEAALTGQLDLARLLLDRGADANVKTDDGRTALGIAQEAKQVEMVKLLSSRGARD